MVDLWLKDVDIADGSGVPIYHGHVLVENGKITKIIKENEENTVVCEAQQIIDGEGLLLCPGFIDMHSHADLTVFRYPDAENLIGQGITTAFTGHCGMSVAPIGRFWKTQSDDLYSLESVMPLASVSSFPGVTPTVPSEILREAMRRYYGVEMPWTSFGEYTGYLQKTGTGINLVMEVGLQQIRASVVGLDMERPATEEEISKMKKKVEEAMEAGASGLSIGFDYTPDMYASEHELDELAKVVRQYHGILTAHTRNDREDDENFMPGDGIREFLEIGRRTGVHVHVSHIGPYEPFMKNDPEKIAESCEKVLSMIEEYRKLGVEVTWDVLHPEAASIFYDPELCAPFQFFILTSGGKAAFAQKLQDVEYRKHFVEDISAGKHIFFPRLDTEAVVTVCKRKEYLGRKLSEIAQELQISVHELVASILAEDIDAKVRPRMPWERLFLGDFFWLREDACIGTDNQAADYDYEARRPDLPAMHGPTTAYNGFVFFLKKSLERKIPVEQTIRKLTGNAAAILGLKERGLIREGYAADLVLIAPSELDERRNFVDTRQKPAGIAYVIVNGRIAAEQGEHTHCRSGQIL